MEHETLSACFDALMQMLDCGTCRRHRRMFLILFRAIAIAFEHDSDFADAASVLRGR